MYSILLDIHNVLRWAVLLFGLYAITKSILGIMHKREFTAKENRAHVIFLACCHTQLLVGIILFFVSPIVDAALASGEVMKDPNNRFVVVEHTTVMVIAIVLIQVGRILSKKAPDSMAKHKKALIFYSIGMLLILSRIPWNKALFPGAN